MHISIQFIFVSLYILHDTFFTTTCITTGCKYLFLCMCPSTLCAHLSLFTSSMTPSSPLPAQQQTVSTLVFMMYVSIHFMNTFTSSMTPSPLPLLQDVSIVVFNPRRACAARVTVVGSVCLCVCLLSHIPPTEHLFVLKTLSRTQRAKKVKRFVGICLK